MNIQPSHFLNAERLLKSPAASDLDFYRLVHDAAAQLVKVDAFYVCLVQRSPDWLHFVYNCEGQVFDTPEPFPIGNGPTSWVACHRKPYIITKPEHRQGLDYIHFGNVETTTGSAVHWPMWINSSDGELPDGVISVQAYTSQAYEASHLEAIEWLALRASSMIRRRREASFRQSSIKMAEDSVAKNRAIADVKRFVTVLDNLTSLIHDPDQLLTQIRRMQVELTQWAPTAGSVSDPLVDEISKLSDRELEVLSYVADGKSNKEAGKLLYLSEHTVKRHLDNVYRQTTLRNRVAIANASQAIQRVRVARSGH